MSYADQSFKRDFPGLMFNRQIVQVMDQTARAANVVNKEPEGLKYGVGFGALICATAKMVRGLRPLHTLVTFAVPAAIISYLVASRNVQIRDLTRRANELEESARSSCKSAEEAKDLVQTLQEEIDGLRFELKKYQDDLNLRKRIKTEEEENQRKQQELQKEQEITELRKRLLELEEALKITQSKQ